MGSYIELMEKFLEEQLNELTPLEAVMYLNLFHIRNKARLANGKQLPEWFTVKNCALASIMGKDEQGIRRLKQSLKEKGLIDYQQGKKGTPTQYHLIDGGEKEVKIRGEKLPPKDGNGVKTPPENYPLNYPLFEAQTLTVQGLADPLREKENKRIKRGKKKDKPFSPPSLEEIRAYIDEKKLPIDAQYFFDYFTEGDWHDSKGNPVKNWKQKALTWARHNKQEAPPPDTPDVWDELERNARKEQMK